MKKAYITALALCVLWAFGLAIYAILTQSQVYKKVAVCTMVPAYLCSLVIVSMTDDEGR